jgi:hypothetical protein
MSLDLVAVEREVHFFHAVPLGARAKMRLGSRCAPLKRMQSLGFMRDDTWSPVLSPRRGIIIHREHSPPVARR